MFLTTSYSFYQRRVFLLLLFLVFTVFTADILDLRDEILIPANAYDNLDENITSGMQSASAFTTPEMPRYIYLPQQSAAPICGSNCLPFDLRAPPLHS